MKLPNDKARRRALPQGNKQYAEYDSRSTLDLSSDRGSIPLSSTFRLFAKPLLLTQKRLLVQVLHFKFSLRFPSLVFPCYVLTLVVQFFSFGQAYLYLCQASAKIYI